MDAILDEIEWRKILIEDFYAQLSFWFTIYYHAIGSYITEIFSLDIFDAHLFILYKDIKLHKVFNMQQSWIQYTVHSVYNNYLKVKFSIFKSWEQLAW